jgi:membrane protein
MRRVARSYRVLSRATRATFLSVLEHDSLNIAQSTAYSAIVALFPALIVAAAVINLLPDTAPIRFQLAAFFGRVLPPGVTPLFAIAFGNTTHTHSVRAMISAAVVSFLSASNVIATLMEGLRRAQDQRRDSWTFWQRRLRSFKLVPLALAPLALVSLLVMFGHAVTSWFVSSLGPTVRAIFVAVTLIIRWVIALSASVGVIALIYHAGVPEDTPATVNPRLRGVRGTLDEHVFSHVPLIRATLPGAIVATVMWFVTTLLFGWYVTRFANYSEVYGSLGAGIALLFWLYIISLSVLCGAEFNAQLDKERAIELKRAVVLASEPAKTGES